MHIKVGIGGVLAYDRKDRGAAGLGAEGACGRDKTRQAGNALRLGLAAAAEALCATLPSMQVMLQDQALHLSDPNPDLPWAFKQVRGGREGTEAAFIP